MLKTWLLICPVSPKSQEYHTLQQILPAKSVLLPALVQRTWAQLCDFADAKHLIQQATMQDHAGVCMPYLALKPSSPQIQYLRLDLTRCFMMFHV